MSHYKHNEFQCDVDIIALHSHRYAGWNALGMSDDARSIRFAYKHHEAGRPWEPKPIEQARHVRTHAGRVEYASIRRSRGATLCPKPLRSELLR